VLGDRFGPRAVYMAGAGFAALLACISHTGLVSERPDLRG